MAGPFEAEVRIRAVDENVQQVFDNVEGKVNKLSRAIGSGGDAVAKFGGHGVAAMNAVGNAADRVDTILTKITGMLASGYIVHKMAALAEESFLLTAKLDDARRRQEAVAGGKMPAGFIEQQ